MRRYLIACLLPVMAVVVHNAGPNYQSGFREGISTVQRSLTLYEMEQRQLEMDRAAQQFRAGAMD